MYTPTENEVSVSVERLWRERLCGARKGERTEGCGKKILSLPDTQFRSRSREREEGKGEKIQPASLLSSPLSPLLSSHPRPISCSECYSSDYRMSFSVAVEGHLRDVSFAQVLVKLHLDLRVTNTPD